MKLRVYTAQETDNLIANIKLICNHIVDVNKDAIELFDAKYKEYLAAFKPGLIFKRKPLTRNKFISKCFYNQSTMTSIYDHKDSYMASYIFFEENFTETFEYCRFEPKLRYFDNHFTKYGVQGWTQEDTEVLNRAGGSTNYFFERWTFREWYAILVKYAHRPFEFDKDDVEILEIIERKTKRAKEYYEAKNAV
ncbi:hypothetical protein XbC2_95 [Xanthomonas phage XbC2]|nr:hypothetical protein XbC2_95 [Xanthomonas phage XbC2]